MLNFIQENWLQSLFLTLLISIAGTAVWEKLVRPILEYLAKLLYKLFTFGRQKAKNEAYIRAADAINESAVVSIHLLFYRIFSGCVLALLFMYVWFFPTLVGWDCFFLDTLEAVRNCRFEKIVEFHENDPSESILNIWWPIHYYVATIMILMIFFGVVRALIVQSKANEIIRTFKYSLDKEGTAFSYEQRLKYKQDFVNIKCAEDYERILKDIASKTK